MGHSQGLREEGHKVEIISKTAIPSRRRPHKREIREILGALETLDTGKAVKVSLATQLEAKKLQSALIYYRNSRYRSTEPVVPNLKVAIRENCLFCWKEG